MERMTIKDAPQCLNTNDKAMWATGWNECIERIDEDRSEQPCPRCAEVEASRADELVIAAMALSEMKAKLAASEKDRDYWKDAYDMVNGYDGE